MGDLRIFDHLYGYFKTTYFTGILATVIILAIALKYTPCGPWVLKLQTVNERTQRRILFMICVLAVLIRIVWLLTCHYRPAFQWTDKITNQMTFTEYDQINLNAVDITKGIWFRTAEGLPLVRRPMGYPTFLGFVYTVFGANVWALYSLQLLLCVATIISIYLLGSRMYDRGVGLVSAAFFAFYPTFIYSIVLALDEHLFLPLWFFGLYLLLEEAQGRPKRFSLLWYGLIFGYATMTRTHTLFMPLVVAYAYYLLKYPKKKILMGLIAVFLISQVPTIPWVIRNYRIWNDYIPYSASAFELYESNNAAVRGGDNNGKIPNVGEPGYTPDFFEAVQKNDIRSMQRIARREVISWILHDPVRFIGMGTVRVLHFMAADRSRGVWSIDLVEEALKLKPDKKLAPSLKKFCEEAAFGSYYVYLYLFFGGFVWTYLRWKRLRPDQQRCLLIIGACFFLYLGEQFVIYPERKYRLPIQPFMFIVAAAFLKFLFLEAKVKFPRRPS